MKNNVEVATTSRSSCRQCGGIIGKGEKKATINGYALCDKCFSEIVQAWNGLKGYKEQVKATLLECVGNKTRKLTLFD